MIFDEGDTDVDATGFFDQRGMEPPRRRIGVSWDVEVPADKWPAARAAAAAGQVAFDAHLQNATWMLPEALALYAHLPQSWREAVRRGCLGIAP